MDRFRGKSCVVTGGAQGIGRSVVERLVDEGASVVLADLDGPLAASTAREIGNDATDRVAAVEADVANRDDVRRAVQEAVDRFGRLDVMVSHAGIADVEPFLDQDDESFAKMLGVNLVGAFMCIQESARAMSQTGGGAIVATGSTNAFWIESNSAAYNASK
jgi:NAD(P)-dependent dehydrogenase (short-subunit alcohol dehydrogenase family)